MLAFDEVVNGHLGHQESAANAAGGKGACVNLVKHSVDGAAEPIRDRIYVQPRNDPVTHTVRLTTQGGRLHQEVTHVSEAARADYGLVIVGDHP